MIPSKTWYPTSLQERAAWHDNFATNFGAIATTLGFVAADVTAVLADNAVMQFLATTATSIQAYSDAVRSFRRVVTEHNVGDPIPAFPPDFTPVPPPSVPTGIFERTDFFARRIRVSAAYTEEVGSLLGVIPKTPESTPIGGTKPVLVVAAKPNSNVEVTFVRGRSGGISLQTITDKGDWVDAGRFVRSPAALLIPHNADHLPRSVQVRGRFLDGNDPVGDWSDVSTVQTIP